MCSQLFRIACIAGLAFPLSVFGANELFQTSGNLTGTYLNNYSGWGSGYPTVSAEDQQYGTMSAGSWQNKFDNRSTEAYIIAGVSVSDQLYAAAFTYNIILDIKYYTWNVSSASFDSSILSNQNITISYDPTSAQKYLDRKIIRIKDAFKVVVKVKKIMSNGSQILPGSGVEDNIYIDAGGYTERYYAFRTTQAVTGLTHTRIPAARQVEVSWDTYKGAESYDLEWAWIDDYSAAGYIANVTALSYDFRNNATRIALAQTSYKIAVIYSHGYLVYRVRPIGIGGAEYDQWVLGTWSCADSASLAAVTDTVFIQDNSTQWVHEDSLNWQYTATFAEGGKRKEVVSYFDGSLRNRESVTNLSTEEVALATETIYDHQGRPAVQILPAPVDGSAIKYYDGLNKNTSGYPYTKTDFDTDDPQDTCIGLIGALSLQSGAGKYYSNQNPDKAGASAYIPDAQGWPMALTQYTADMTGRIRRQGGIGPDHQLESGHETRYYYAAPLQVEIDRLFGTEAGEAIHYKKVVSIDPNGQTSTVITDLAGKTIVTALSGDKPENMGALNSYDSLGSEITVDLTERNERTEKIEISFPLIVDHTGEYIFYYKTLPVEVASQCLPGNLCLDCIYSISISIKNECNEEMIPNGPFTKVIGTADGVCDDSIAWFSAFPSGLNILLPYGQYSINKVLQLAPDSVEAYADLFMESQTCLKTLEDFIREELDSLDFKDCSPNICESVCREKYLYMLIDPATSGFYADSADYYTALTAFNDSVDACASDCPEPGRCDGYLMAIKEDFKPGGQYATYSVDQNGVYTSTDELSVFTKENSLPDAIFYDRSTIVYSDGYGNIDTVVSPSTGKRVRPNSLHLDEFVYLFKDSWADSLVKYHPEYCYYSWCVSNEPSDTFDLLMLQTETYDEAVTLGLLNPAGVATGQLPSTLQSMTFVMDPYFDTGGNGADDRQRFIDSLTIHSDGQYTIWESAVLAVNCTKAQNTGACVTSLTFGSVDCTKDKEWQYFRAMYLSKKLQFQEIAITRYVIENKCYNGCIGNGNFSSADDDFDCHDSPPASYPCTTDNNKYDGYADPDQPCYSTHVTAYATKVKRVPRVSDALNIDVWDKQAMFYNSTSFNKEGDLIDTVHNAFNSHCEQYCDSTAYYWMDVLAGCEAIVAALSPPELWEPGNTIYDSVLVELIEVCKLGCDTLHPLGASTTPGSTTTSGGNSSFEEVIYNIVFSGSGIDTLCDGLLITMPKPYDYNFLGSTTLFPELDTCACNLIDSLYTVYENTGNPPTGYNNFSEFFLDKTGVYIPFISEKVCACREIKESHDGPEAWHQDEVTDLSLLDMYVPLEIVCRDCIECEAIGEHVQNFLSYYNLQASDIPRHKILFTNYMNKIWGWNFSTDQMLSFYLDCDSLATDAGEPYFFKGVTEEGIALKKLLNQIIEKGWFGQEGQSYGFGYLTGFVDGILNPHASRADCFVMEQWKDVVSSEFIYTLLMIDTCTGDTCSIVFTGDEDNFESLNGLDSLYYYAPHITGSEDLGYDCPVNSFSFTLGEEPSAGVLIYGTSSCYYIQNCINPGILLCNEPLFQTIQIDTLDCARYLIELAVKRGHDRYEAYIDSIRNAFIEQYKYICLTQVTDSFKMTYTEIMHHYTLYYYDRAGNLVKTVPPEGVHPLTSAADLQQVKDYRQWKKTGQGSPVSAITPNHTLYSRYWFTSYNQIRGQQTPDAGNSQFWYDKLGRIVASQNGNQAVAEVLTVGGQSQGSQERYSYTRFDAIGRIIEVGERHSTVNPTSTEYDDFANWPGNFGIYPHEVTKTRYDNSMSGLPVTQTRLRNRVSSVTFREGFDTTVYDYATHYSYDYHGNVHEMWQEFKDIDQLAGKPDNGLFHIAYSYDLVSGNVNEVRYQQGLTDQFIHRYTYDADNRITLVETSREGIIWDRDATYSYYLHGPLARVELGEYQVQGLDYAYTIQGWIKGINSNILNADNDMGKDASSTSYTGSGTNPHRWFAKDAFSFSLHYYGKDYTAIDSANIGASNYFLAGLGGSDFAAASPNLWNGNIRAMTTTFLDNTETLVSPLGTVYKYDQLNRLSSMRTHTGISSNAWGTGTGSMNWATNYRYDAVGNIDTLSRRDQNGNLLDSMIYRYQTDVNGELIRNRLYHVNETAGSTAYDGDIEALPGSFTNNTNPAQQATGNYAYDRIGNLRQDASEKISNIDWTVYGKIASITRNASGYNHMWFAYGPDGQRWYKRTLEQGTTDTTDTWYVRDAQGNVMATYTLNSERDSLYLSEQYLYGSSRLGYSKRNEAVQTHTLADIDSVWSELGNKQYELSNHLGNVITVISDQKIAIDQNTNDTVDYYLPNVLISNDYYPFGMLMPGRNFSSDTYRFGFQNQEKDDEIKGVGNSVNYKYRVHDPRLGRFLSVDPLYKAYPQWAPYVFSGNQVISSMEIEGLEPKDDKNINPSTSGSPKTLVQKMGEELGMATGVTLPSQGIATSNIPSESTNNQYPKFITNVTFGSAGIKTGIVNFEIQTGKTDVFSFEINSDGNMTSFSIMDGTKEHKFNIGLSLSVYGLGGEGNITTTIQPETNRFTIEGNLNGILGPVEVAKLNIIIYETIKTLNTTDIEYFVGFGVSLGLGIDFGFEGTREQWSNLVNDFILKDLHEFDQQYIEGPPGNQWLKWRNEQFRKNGQNPPGKN